ncbi:MAG: hypothetical protein JRE23_18470 [Deltaproteobacteria bacterium]|nr:hypothetical protein [Deltaproteobacteria bacterium]
MSRYHTLKYKKDIVKLFLKRAPGVSRARFALIHDLSDTTVKEWVLKYSTGDSKDKKE